MSMIPGDIGYIKFTGEAVGILQLYTGSNQVDVRRCVRSKQNGSSYVRETYFLYELESETDHSLRRRQDMEDLAAALKGANVAVLDDRPKGPSKPPTSYDNTPN